MPRFLAKSIARFSSRVTNGLDVGSNGKTSCTSVNKAKRTDKTSDSSHKIIFTGGLTSGVDNIDVDLV